MKSLPTNLRQVFDRVSERYHRLRSRLDDCGSCWPRTPPPTDPVRPPTPRQVALSWARRLKRMFGIEIEIEGYVRCGGQLRIIASIEEHLERTAPQQYPTALPLGARAPPLQSSLL